jgi:hypothetical protein
MRNNKSLALWWIRGEMLCFIEGGNHSSNALLQSGKLCRRKRGSMLGKKNVKMYLKENTNFVQVERLARS